MRYWSKNSKNPLRLKYNDIFCLHRNSKIVAFRMFLEFTVILTHSEAQGERVFNRLLIFLLKISQLSITSQRAICDFMNNTKCDPHDLLTHNELRRSCWNARSKYQCHCEKKSNWKRQINHIINWKLN